MKKVTLIGMYNFDNTIFASLSMPDGLEAGIAVNTILREKGEFCSLYTNPDFLKFAIGTWSQENQMAFKHLAKVWQAEYDPISNYNRTEEETIKATGSSNSEDKVSAFDSSSYQPSGKNDLSEQNDSTRKLHAFGNIGTTTNAQMMLAEKEVVEEVNPYIIIANMFADAFCVKVY